MSSGSQKGTGKSTDDRRCSLTMRTRDERVNKRSTTRTRDEGVNKRSMTRTWDEGVDKQSMTGTGDE